MSADYIWVSRLFSATFIVLIIILLSFLARGFLAQTEVIDLSILAFIILFTLLAILTGINSFAFDYFKKYLMFCSTLIFLFIVSRIRVTKDLIDFILIGNFILFGAYFAFYILGNAPLYSGKLALNFTNPNLLALWLLHTVLYLIITNAYYHGKFLKFISLGAVGATLFMVFETGTRSVLIALAVFAISFCLIYLRNNFQFGKILTAFFILYPILFASIYMMVVNNPTIINLFDFFTSPGKALDSRVEIWAYAFAVIKDNLLFGDYNQISGGTGSSQMLNTHIDVMASYGCLVFGAFIIYLYRIIIPISKMCSGKLQKIALASFFATIIMGSGEAAFVSGSVGMYILSCSFLLIARYEN